MTISEINTSIIQGNLTNDELTSIIDAVKFARAKLSRQNLWQIKKGDNVSFTGRDGRTVTGSVFDVKIKNVIVLVGMTRWKVPANMLTKVA